MIRHLQLVLLTLLLLSCRPAPREEQPLPPGSEQAERPLLCEGATGNCDGDDANGCETDLALSSEHCGACGLSCASPGRCQEGRCVADVLVDISRGKAHSCALWQSGRVSCWGVNRFAQLGDGSTSDRFQPVWVHGVESAVGVLAGRNQSCALLSDGAVRCWGLLLFDVPIDQLPELLQPTASTPPELAEQRFVELRRDPNERFGICAMLEQGDGVCLGGLSSVYEKYSSIRISPPRGNERDRSRSCLEYESENDLPPSSCVEVEVQGNWVRIALLEGGVIHTIANDFSEGLSLSLPERVELMDDAVDWDSGGVRGTCSVHRDGSVHYWHGKLNDESCSRYGRSVNHELLPFVDAVECEAHSKYVCARSRAGEVGCVGFSPETSNMDAPPCWEGFPEVIEELEGARQLSAGAGMLCAIDKEGVARCSGWYRGAIAIRGGSHAAERFRIVDRALLSETVSLASGSFYSCALRQDGAVVCWGGNQDNVLGWAPDEDCESPQFSADHPEHTHVAACNFSPSANVPIGAEPDNPVVQLDVGASMVCVRRQKGSVECWGEWGNESYSDSRSGFGGRVRPLPIPGVEDAVDLCVGSMGCALTAAGKVQCWGSNNWGQLGDGTRLPRTRAYEVAGLPVIERLLCNHDAVCAYDADSQAWCWGRFNLEQLGGAALRDPRYPQSTLYALDPPRDPGVDVQRIAADFEAYFEVDESE